MNEGIKKVKDERERRQRKERDEWRMEGVKEEPK